MVEVGGHSDPAHYRISAVALASSRDAKPHLVVYACRHQPCGLVCGSDRIGNHRPSRSIVLGKANLVGASVGFRVPTYGSRLAWNEHFSAYGVGQFHVLGYQSPGNVVFLASTLGYGSANDKVKVSGHRIEHLELFCGIKAVHCPNGGAV